MTDELTNLNWLCSITTAKSLQQAAGLASGGKDHKRMKLLLPATTGTSAQPPRTNSQRRAYNRTNDTVMYTKGLTQPRGGSYYARPSCSYSCLIAMALKASTTGCLPVHEIYRFVEQEYPFYKTAPEGWKNSIRHNLSMNQNFVKVQRPDGFQTKKGYYWAANPARQNVLDLEIERALKTMGRELIENSDMKQQFYHSSLGLTLTAHCTNGSSILTINHQQESEECSNEEQDDDNESLLLDAPHVDTKVTKRLIDKFNLIAGIKTPMGRYFPVLIRKEASVVTVHAIKSDSDALMELFGTSFNTNDDTLKTNKQIAGTKRQAQVPTSYLPYSKSQAIEPYLQDHATLESHDDTPPSIRPYYNYCYESVGYGNDDDDDDDSKVSALIEEIEDEELLEVLKSCSKESSLFDEGEEQDEVAVIMTEDDGYMILNDDSTGKKKQVIVEKSDSCTSAISEICHEFYTTNPSLISMLPDVSTREKALKYITEETEECSLPQLELNELELFLPNSKSDHDDSKQMYQLDDSDNIELNAEYF